MMVLDLMGRALSLECYRHGRNSARYKVFRAAKGTDSLGTACRGADDGGPGFPAANDQVPTASGWGRTRVAMAERFPITPKGAQKLKEELARLKEERPKISRDIGVAREHGDLSENAEYHAAKERQGMV